jgi:hypothetical protein
LGTEVPRILHSTARLPNEGSQTRFEKREAFLLQRKHEESRHRGIQTLIKGRVVKNAGKATSENYQWFTSKIRYRPGGVEEIA